MAILILFGLCLVAGGMLYLPFFLWFRYRRRKGREVGPPLPYTRTGLGLVAVEVLLVMAGLGARDAAPESSLGRFMRGPHGPLEWVIAVTVVVAALGALLRQAGVATAKARPAYSHTRASDRQRVRPEESRWRARIATVRGVPVFVHVSLPLAGMTAIAVMKPGPVGALGYCLASIALIALHESGHFVAARVLRLRVFSVDISGLGGLCRTQAPRGVRDTFILYAAGLATQAALLVLTLGVVGVLGWPGSAFGQAVAVTFTFVNGWMFALNLLPRAGENGVSSDGKVLWELLLHVARGRPHPHAAHHAASPLFPPATRLVDVPGMVPEGFATGIELLNDDATPMAFVIEMLEKHARLTREAAIQAMRTVHGRGGALLPLASFEDAQAVADAVARDARAAGHPLVCRAVDARAVSPPPSSP